LGLLLPLVFALRGVYRRSQPVSSQRLSLYCRPTPAAGLGPTGGRR